MNLLKAFFFICFVAISLGMEINQLEAKTPEPLEAVHEIKELEQIPTEPLEAIDEIKKLELKPETEPSDSGSEESGELTPEQKALVEKLRDIVLQLQQELDKINVKKTNEGEPQS